MKKLISEVLTKKNTFQPEQFDEISSQETERSGMQSYQSSEGAIRYDKPNDHRSSSQNRHERQKFRLNMKKVIILILLTFFLFFASKMFFSKIKGKKSQQIVIVEE